MASRPIRTMTVLTATAALCATAHAATAVAATAHAASAVAATAHAASAVAATAHAASAVAATAHVTSTSAVAATAHAASTSAVASAAPAAPAAGRHVPRIVTAWARAWNGTDPQALGALFTADGTYTDEAVAVTFRGREEIAGWKARADTLIENVHVTVRSTRLEGDRVTVRALYSGHLKGASKPFAVPMTTVLGLDGNHCRIVFDRDHYSLAAVLSQSGLPADWTPPAA
ncbi:nuclear transport factor 2 family protein [Streptomyces sp. NBC_01233]|uniref:nuclear transport factor 2 family protein n=1 Tax=Streptomyces sp. NBC_01233 TaxID=2903787 RepID=UPI002E12D5C5|nr:nuclear transport factor 2 family protein [Streptomyces sp. NBC_01233]WSP95211.1 nuclear transport factor 2 family protein [Streptomyces sp. NBC_01233]